MIKTNKLIEWLTENSYKATESKTTNSMYFIMDNYKIRISDHFSNNNDQDLDILFLSSSRFIIITSQSQLRVPTYFNTFTDGINYIRNWLGFYRLYNPKKPNAEVFIDMKAEPEPEEKPVKAVVPPSQESIFKIMKELRTWYNSGKLGVELEKAVREKAGMISYKKVQEFIDKCKTKSGYTADRKLEWINSYDFDML